MHGKGDGRPTLASTWRIRISGVPGPEGYLGAGERSGSSKYRGTMRANKGRPRGREAFRTRTWGNLRALVVRERTQQSKVEGAWKLVRDERGARTASARVERDSRFQSSGRRRGMKHAACSNPCGGGKHVHAEHGDRKEARSHYGVCLSSAYNQAYVK